MKANFCNESAFITANPRPVTASEARQSIFALRAFLLLERAWRAAMDCRASLAMTAFPDWSA